MTKRAERLVEWHRKTSCRVELRSGQKRFKAVMDSLTSWRPYSLLLLLLLLLIESTVRFAKSSDRRDWRRLGSERTWKSIQRTAGTVLTRRAIHVVSSNRA